MSNNKQAKKGLPKSNSTIDTGSEFATEFGEGLYGAQARLAYEQKKGIQKNKHKNNL